MFFFISLYLQQEKRELTSIIIGDLVYAKHKNGR